MVIHDTMGPLPKGIGHIMRMTFLAPKLWYLNFAREPIFLFPSSLEGGSPVGVTTTLVTSIPSATMPLMGRLPRVGGISRYSDIIRGVAVVEGWPSYR